MAGGRPAASGTLLSPDVVDQVGLADLGHDLAAGVYALGAVDALDLEWRLADVDIHRANAHALPAFDAIVSLVAVMDEESVLVADESLQVTVGTYGRAETQADEREVEERQEGDCTGPGDGGGAAEGLPGLDEVRDEGEAKEHGRDCHGGIKQDAPNCLRITSLDRPPDEARFERCRGLAEDHLRAEIAAIDPAVEHRHRDHQEHQEHQGEEDDREFVDPEVVAEEVEALPGNVEADDVKEGHRQRTGSNRSGGPVCGGDASYPWQCGPVSPL